MRTIVLCGFALGGIALGDVTHISPQQVLPPALLGLLGAALCRRHATWCTLALGVAALALGCLRTSFGPINTPITNAPLSELRVDAEARIHAYLPEPHASLAAGVLLGGSGKLDRAFRTDLQRSGLAHLVAIDGFKQVIVAAAVGGSATWLLGARVGTLVSLAAILAYTLLTGAHPSAVRAGLMAGLAALAAATGRVADPLTSLLLAVLGMATIEPRILLDLGLQLSLSATLGIVLFWPRLRHHLRRLPRVVAEPVGLTLSVTLASLPVTLSTFQQVSLVSPLAHVLAVPLVPAILLGAGFLAVCSAMLPVAALAAWLVWLSTSVLAWLVHAFGSLPGAAISTGRLSHPAAIWLAVALLAWGSADLPELRAARFALWRAALRRRRVLAPAACIGACLASAAVLGQLRPDGRLHVDQLAAGSGQAFFIRGPSGHTVLLVAGRAEAVALSAELGDRLAVWEHRVDSAIALDRRAERALRLALARYPAGELRREQAPIDVDVGGGAVLEIATDGPVVSVRSAPTTFAARPGSAD